MSEESRSNLDMFWGGGVFMDDNIQKILKDYINNKKVKRNEILDKLGISYATLRNWETGKTVPRGSYLVKLEEFVKMHEDKNRDDDQLMDKLRELVEDESFNRNRLAASLGVSCKLIYRWVYGIESIEPRYLIKLRKILDKNIDDFYLYNNDQKLVSAWIKAIKRDKHLGTAALSNKIKISADTIKSSEDGKAAPVLKQLINVNNLCGYRIDFDISRLTEYRKERKISQQQVADAVGVNYSTVMRWETGDRMPSSECYLRLAVFFKDSSFINFINKK